MLMLIGGFNIDVVLTRRPLSGLEAMEQHGVAVKVDFISPETTASETIIGLCIV